MTHPTNQPLPRTSALALCLLCALAMAYGWGWRGSYGHEHGAMFPGALLGMAICLASGRDVFYRRAPLAGLCGAVGWAWGGGLSNMEQTFYAVSDSLSDVLFAYACLFLVGALWSGMGSAVLSLAVTRPRSELNALIRPLAFNSAALLAAFLYFYFAPADRQTVDHFGEEYLHDSKFLPATIILVASSAYWLARPAERAAAGLFVRGAAAWWIGYLALTRFGGLVLAPPNRSESWGGFVGVLAVLVAHLARQRNRAGLMMTGYGILSGGIAFVLAQFLVHPLVARWGPFAETTITNTWKLTEESFGFFMGLGVALAAVRLLRGPLRPPADDAPASDSNLFASFVLLIAMMWMNLPHNVRDWGNRYDLLPHHRVAGLLAWQWYFVVGVALTLVGLYALWKVRRGTLDALLPPTAFGKGALLFLLVLWSGQFGVAMHRFADLKSGSHVVVEFSYWILAVATTAVLLACTPANDLPHATTATAPDAADDRWRLGRGYWLLWACVPVLLLAVTCGAMAMQDGPLAKARLRFGPSAYWRLELDKKNKKAEATTPP